jgi:hypothetical protein
MAHARSNPIYNRPLGGVVSVHEQRDRYGEEPVFRVSRPAATSNSYRCR